MWKLFRWLNSIDWSFPVGRPLPLSLLSTSTPKLALCHILYLGLPLGPNVVMSLSGNNPLRSCKNALCLLSSDCCHGVSQTQMSEASQTHLCSFSGLWIKPFPPLHVEWLPDTLHTSSSNTPPRAETSLGSRWDLIELMFFPVLSSLQNSFTYTFSLNP